MIFLIATISFFAPIFLFLLIVSIQVRHAAEHNFMVLMRDYLLLKNTRGEIPDGWCLRYDGKEGHCFLDKVV